MTDFIPFSQESERGLLGAALIDGSIPASVDITPDDFYVEGHRWIWQAMVKLSMNGGVNYVSLLDELERAGHLSEVGGAKFVNDLMSGSFSSLYAEDHAQVIRDMATRRKLLSLASDMANAAADRKQPIDDLSRFIDRLVNTTRVTGGALHWKMYLAELFDQIAERAANPQDTWGIPTGFADFDRTTGGLQLGESMIMSGNPGVGKSMLAVQMATQMAKHAPGAIYSIEMAGVAVLRRTLSARTSIPSRLLKSGRLEQKDWQSIDRAVAELNDLPVYLSDHAGWTTTALRADLSRLKIKHLL